VPLARLVTWNQFFSASAYERDEPITWSGLEDLSALIDLLCMYDSLVVIGDPANPPFLTHTTDFFGAMRGSRAVDVQGPPEPDALADLTSRHLTLCLPDLTSDQVASWIDASLRLNRIPEDRERVATMNADIRLGDSLPPSPSDLARRLADPGDAAGLRPFVVRTFMYSAYAELAGIPFAVDSARFHLVAASAARESNLASQLLASLRRQWEDFPVVGHAPLRRRTSPFSAIVLERCGGDRRAVPDEILRLRDEMSAIRKRLAEAEEAIRSAETRDAAIRREQKWRGILGEIERSFGPSPSLVSLHHGLALSGAAGKALGASDPSGYLAALCELPVEVVARLYKRQPVAVLHALRSHIPNARRLAEAIQRVFPEATARLRGSPEPPPRSDRTDQ